MHGPMRSLTQEAERPENRQQVLNQLLVELRPYRWPVILSLIFVMISGAAQGLGPVIIGNAVDQFITGRDAAGLARSVLLLTLVFAAGSFATRFQIFFTARTGQLILAQLRERVFAKLQSLSLQFLESKQAGDLMSRLVNDIDALNNFFSQALPQFIGALFALVGIVVAMVLVSPLLALAVLLAVPVLLITTGAFARRARNAYRQTRETIGDVSANLEEELGGVKVAQAYNRTGENIRRFAMRNAANRDANVSATAITSAFAPTMDVISTLDLALVAALGGMLAIRGDITVGVVVTFIQYVQNFFRPIQTVAQLWTTTQSAFAAAERVFDLLAREGDVRDAPDALDLRPIQGNVEFQDVSFSYMEGQPVLEEINFTAVPGQTVALVGPTGAGKTTLVGLIARFYDPDTGRVLIDGQDIRMVTQRSLRGQMGIVTQEPFLFSGTVLENIRYGRLTASREEVIQAAQAANADEFIQHMQYGYDTEVGQRGSLLSQGQRQLISIARAILADPRILIQIGRAHV